METKEKTNDEKEFMGWPNMSCCGTQGSQGKMPDCCESIARDWDCRTMMAECMKKCRWFPLFPVVIGIVLFLLGYYLDAEVTRILWMTVAGLVILMGVFGFLMMSLSKRTCC